MSMESEIIQNPFYHYTYVFDKNTGNLEYPDVYLLTKSLHKKGKLYPVTSLKIVVKANDTDDDIAHLEDGIAALEAEILANATNPGKLNELMREKEKAEHALEEKMNRWVYLNDLAEKIESQKG